MSTKSNPPSQMRIVTPLLRVLLVDDDPAVVRTVKRALLTRRPTWHITSFCNPKDALAKLGSERFDVVVSDYEMPQMNGLEFLTAVRTVSPTALRVIISGRARTSVSGLGMAPIHAWMDKQRGNEELASVIEDLVQRRRKGKRAATEG